MRRPKSWATVMIRLESKGREKLTSSESRSSEGRINKSVKRSEIGEKKRRRKGQGKMPIKKDSIMENPENKSILVRHAEIKRVVKIIRENLASIV